MAWQHSTEYRHYMQLYPSGDTEYPEIDIEENFKCRYVSLTNAVNPSVKSVFTENFAEQNGLKVYAPDIAVFDSSEMVLTLRWVDRECSDVKWWSEYFASLIAGHKFQYHDTFRPNKYWQFVLTNSPEIVGEKLQGANQYRFMSFKLTNFGGRPTTKSLL